MTGESLTAPGVAALLLAFAVLWYTMGHFMAVLSGWKSLATTYRAHGRPYGDRFLWQYGKVGIVYQRASLNIWASPDGIFLSMPFLFTAGHPRLFIPIADLHPVGKRPFLWWHHIKFEIGSPSITSLTVSPAVLDSLGLEINAHEQQTTGRGSKPSS